MGRQINEQLWHQLTQEIMTGMREWRLQHPKATLREIETELDARMNSMRARMLEALALHRTAAAWEESPGGQQPRCPPCGERLQDRGSHARTLLTHGGQEVTLPRSYGVCPACQSGLFPPRR